MSESNHDLASEFPEYKEAIHTLKTKNSHFQKLFDQYSQLNKSVNRAELRIDIKSQMEEEKMRKERLKIKDELFKMLIEHSKNV